MFVKKNWKFKFQMKTENSQERNMKNILLMTFMLIWIFIQLLVKMFIKLIFIIIVLALNSCKCSLNEENEEENPSEKKSMEENLKILKSQENQKKDHSKNEQLVERDNLIYLSELPLDKLLQVKKSIEEIIKSVSNDIVYDDEDYDDFQFANDKIKQRIVSDAEEDDDKWNKQQRKQLARNKTASNRMEHVGNDKARIVNDGNYVTAPTALPLINNYNYNRHFNRYRSLDREYYMMVLGLGAWAWPKSRLGLFYYIFKPDQNQDLLCRLFLWNFYGNSCQGWLIVMEPGEGEHQCWEN